MKLIEKLREKLLPRRYGSVEWKSWRKAYKGTSLLKLAHSLEKGQGFANTVAGRGKEKAQKLIELLKKYKRCDDTAFEFLVTLHTLNEYLIFQQEHNIDVDAMMREVISLMDSLSESAKKRYSQIKAGAYIYTQTTQELPDVEKVFSDRHSVRDFDIEQAVDEQQVLDAIRIANLAPSACNRQPCKVYYTLNRETAQKCVPFIPGIKGFEKNVPYFAVITVDRSLFDLSEIYQWFVNGGIFIAYFINALNGVGLGSCVFQFPFNEEKRSKDIHKLIGASDQEAVCAIIGFGKKKKEYKCIYAQRKDVGEIAKPFN